MLLRKLLRDLIHLRGQMIAVAVVVACGIATYVTMVSVYHSLQATQSAYYEEYRFADLFAGARRVPESIARQIASVPGVAAVESRVVVQVTLDVPGLDEPATGRIVSIPEHRAPILNDIHIRRGRYIQEKRDDEVIISEAFANGNSLKTGDTLGAVINGRWRQVRIVGIALSPEYVYEVSGGAAFFPDNRRFGVLWMSREALSAAFDMEGAFNDISLRLMHGANRSEIIDRIDDLLSGYGGLGAYTREDQISNRFLSDEITQLRANGLIVPMIFLGVAAFLLHLTLSRLIATQRDQVAVLKAFGYSNWSVGFHYMQFALTAVIVGAALGVGAGMWLGSLLTEVYTKFYRFPILRYSAGLDVIAWGLIISAGAAAIGALSAVRRAISLPPAEAMRPEPPARFKPGFLEKLGITGLLSTSMRIVVRNIERNPLKAFLSTLGIAMSVAILVVGRYSFDAIRFMIDLQFQRVSREDITIAYNNPRGSGAVYDLESFPSVLRVEPFRTIPVRVRHGHRERRLGIQGVIPDGELHRIVDEHLRVHRPPSDGVLMTRKLGEILDVSPGDTVTIEALEGRRPVRQVVVAGLIDELLGIAVYMDFDALNQLMGEGGNSSGAFVAIDPVGEDLLYEKLKRTPSVAGTVIRKAMLEGFQKTIADNQNISAFTLIFFAGVIAIGIVYNNARIALSEKGRELASLRVLGFTKREIAVILLGEQAILLFMSLPLGFLVGYGICAGLVAAFDTELYRMPLFVTSQSYAFSGMVVLASGVVSALLVRRRLYHLDLVEVLKTRE